MIVAGGQRQAVLDGHGGNPDVILRDWSAFQPYAVSNLSVKLCGHNVAAQHLDCSGELIDFSKVSGCVCGLASAIVKLTKHGARHKHFAFSELFGNRLLSREKRDDDVSVEEDSTRHSARSFRSLPRWLGT